jgi:hypothetical protein
MVANLEVLSEAVDLSTLDRKLADAMEERGLDKIRNEIAQHGYSELIVDGKTFRITKENQAA